MRPPPAAPSIVLVGGEAGRRQDPLRRARLAARLRDAAGSSSRAAPWRSVTTPCRSARSSRSCAPSPGRWTRNASRPPPAPACPCSPGSCPELSVAVGSAGRTAEPPAARLAPGPDLRRRCSGCSAGWRARRRSSSSSRISTGPIGPPATCSPSSPATPARSGCCIVGTFRTDELHRRHPLTAWLAEAERQPRVERLRPRTLRARRPRRAARPADRRRQRAVRGDPARLGRPAVRWQRLLRRGAGRQHRRDRSRARATACPTRSAGVLLVRLASRSDAAARLVEIAAVGGREVGSRRAGRRLRPGRARPRGGAPRSRRRPAPAGRPRRGRRPLPLPSRARPGGRLRPAPAVGAPPPPRGLRRRARGPAGRQRRRAEASRLVELAHHWRSAHEATRALHAAIQAGDASRAVYAYAEAARQYELAIELWDAGRARPTDRPIATWATCIDAASASAILVGDGSRAVEPGPVRRIALVDAAPGADRRSRAPRPGPRAARLRGLAGRRHRDLDPAPRGGGRAARRTPRRRRPSRASWPVWRRT